MQKVLRKRIFRDFKSNFTRYIALSFLIILSMYLVVSMVAAAETIIRGTQKADQEQRVEDGQFSLFVPMKDEEWNRLTDKGITLEKMFFLDYSVMDAKTLRVFRVRKDIDTIALYDGSFAKADDELVLERQFSEKNNIKVGDSISFGGRTFKVAGIGTVPDYDSMLKSLGDTGCDSLNFGLAFMTDNMYETLQKEEKSVKSEEYYYAYRLNDSMTDDELKEELEDLEFSSDDVEDEYFQEYWDRMVGQKGDLKNGIKELVDGSTELADGLGEMTDHNQELQDGAAEILDSYLEQANDKLRGYGIDTLTADNFESVLQNKIDSEDSAITRMAMKNLLKTLQELKEFSDGIAEYTDGAKEAHDGSKELQDGLQELKDETDDMIDKLSDADVGNLLTFLKAEDNVRIQAASGDQELYRSVGTIAGGIILVLIGYVLSVFVVHSIDQESAVIGALYALGVKGKDLMRHYIMLPTVLAGVSGMIGTVLAYLPCGVKVQMQDCYNYYSLPDVKVIIMPYLLVYGIVVPPVICFIVTSLVIRKRLEKPVLSLLKNEQKVKGSGDVKLKHMKFMGLFKIRQIIRERRTAFAVVFGMFISLLLSVMALEIFVYCGRVNKDYVNDTKYEYMYTYKYPEEEPPAGGYKAYGKTMKKEIYGYTFDVTVMGLTDDNPFFDVNLKDSTSQVSISSSIAYKYGLKVGDTFTLKDTEADKLYVFEVNEITQYAPTFTVFMSYDKAIELFGEPTDYYNIVFSDHELPIESGRLYSTITKADVKKGAGIFSDIMRSMILTIGGVSIALFVIVLYLMMKVMIDRSSFSIALVKIFGFRNKEVRKMYLDGNFYVVAIGTLVSIPLAKLIMDALYEPAFVPNIACGVDKSFSVWIYLAMFVTVFVLYFIINHLLVYRIKKMVPAEVLKNRE